MIRACLSVALLIFVCIPQALAQQANDKSAPAEKPLPSQADLDKQFSEAMTGATLVGYFTMGKVDPAKPLKEDRYTLGKVYKIKDDLWQFEAKMRYGGRDLMVPMAIPVKWAGDTPMIALTETTIPGMGTYTARVFVYKDQYAGTWQHGPAGGLMFGRVEPAGATDKAAPAEKPQ
jgi:hypothetical protein